MLADWEVRFEPRALCWILMPETVRGLWKQPLRWSMGGTQVLLDYWPQLMSRHNIGLWPLAIEYGLSIVWAILVVLLGSYRIIDLIVFNIDLQSAPILLFG